MMQKDPNKDIQKPSVKEKLARSSAKKKVGVGEMGKPDFKAGFESAMQKERNTVLNRAKERDKDPDWRKKEALLRFDKNALLDKMNSNIKTSKLKSMSKNKLKY